MAPKHHRAPLSGGDRKALKKELSRLRAMTRILAERSAEKRREGEALIREADNPARQSWNEKMWSDEGMTVSGHHVWYFAVRAMLGEGDEVLRVLKVDIANNNGVRGHPDL